MGILELKRRMGQHLVDTAGRCLAWVERQPRVLRPAIYGAGFIWFLILVRGSIVLPVLLVVALLTDPAQLFPFLFVALVLAPGGGFLGGLAYGLVSPIADRLGLFGTMVKFTVAAWCYLVVLVALIMPVVDGKYVVQRPDSSDWWFIGLFGLMIGIVLTYSTRKDAA